MTNKQYKAVKRTRLNEDSDGDGVPNKNDCRPFDRGRQDEDISVYKSDYDKAHPWMVAKGDIMASFKTKEEADKFKKEETREKESRAEQRRESYAMGEY